MFLQGYLYWCGVIFNAILAFWIIIGACAIVRNWRVEKAIRKKYAVKNLDVK